MQLPAVQTKFLDLPNSFSLRNGATLDKVRVAYEQYGTLTPNKDNAILLFHALSGSQHAYGYNPEVPGIGSLWKPENHEGWWNSIIGPGKPLDTNRFCIICANYLGGCYGTTGPAAPCPADGQPYGSRFPHVEAADQARLQALLLDSLGIERVHLMGPSVGGLIALSFACQFPERVRSFISIGSGYRASIEHRLSLFEQILAIELDPDFQGGDYYRGPAPQKRAGVRPYHRPQIICLPGGAGTTRQKRGGRQLRPAHVDDPHPQHAKLHASPGNQVRGAL